MVLALVAGLLSLFLAGKPALGETNVPPGFAKELVASGLGSPTAMEFAPDGRLFVAEKGGKLNVIKDGSLLDQPFVDLSDQVDSRGERGLLGVAFDPAFGDSNNDYVYVYYTQKASGGTPAHNRIVRFKANGDQAEGGPESVFELNNLSEKQTHNGGAIHFGEDGKLYVAVGDNRRERQVQKLNTFFGKMLRINPDGTIPEDNPYPNASGQNRAIWAKGLRNPFSFAVQPGTGKIHINDVGEKRTEEINLGKAGGNYGWPRYEGHENNNNYDDPIFTYKHDDLRNSPHATSGCAITGGTFYNPGVSATAPFPPEYTGDYFFADFCNGWIRVLDADSGEASGFATGASYPVDLKVGEDGGLYYLERGSGSVEVIRYTG